MQAQYKKQLLTIKAVIITSLIVAFAIQYFYVTPPSRDYFNINLNVVTGVILVFSSLMIWLAIYNYKKINNNLTIESLTDFESIREAYIQTWSPLFGASLVCQLVYFHIFGNSTLLIMSSIAIVLLLLAKIKA